MSIIKRQYKNELQEVAGAISGYGHDESGARDDGYYECLTIADRINYIKELADVLYDIYLSDIETNQILDFLDFDHDGTNDWYYAFEMLKERKEE